MRYAFKFQTENVLRKKVDMPEDETGIPLIGEELDTCVGVVGLC